MTSFSKLLSLLSLLLVFTLTACEIDKTQDGDMPDIDVDVDADVDSGRLPSFDVDWASVDIGTTTKTIKVPKVVVVMEEEEIEVPFIDVDGPDAGELEEQTLMVEAEIEGEAHRLQIEEVYAEGDDLIVIASLEPTGQPLQDQRIRISDRVVLNAPDIDDVDYYIIGHKPEGDFNRRYEFIDSRNALANELRKSRLIYSRNS